MADKNIKADINQVESPHLNHIQGQPKVIEILKINLEAYFNIRSSSSQPPQPFGPVLLSGPSGTGKTMVAQAIHNALGNLHLMEINGVSINQLSDFNSMLLDADENTTFFIDEAQALHKKAQYVLLTAVSERKLYVPGMTNFRKSAVSLFPFTLILATTHEYLLLEALRNRMRINCRFEYYSLADLRQIVRQRIHDLSWNYESEEVLTMIAQRSKGTPRLALNTNLQMCWNIAQSHNRELITLADAEEAFRLLEIDERGCDQTDRMYLQMLTENKRVSLNVLSAKLSQPALTLQRVVEPYLIQEGLITKDQASGRMITEKGRTHLTHSRT